ncbi:MAG: hypothetical protein ETSY1_46485 (plasmid) [Candidatus Entotheonella factor]|uniref:Proteinase inhibitor I42 chagasin domain-containing protein n=2 Tax=Bacteria TaxID=2 RepID=W4M0I0_ENTF1|nr:chagasin-like pepetidase inhibitor [bacterium symbiont of Theonella swinhoei pTSMAC1]ETX03685.1 MAG: hypothetical protein ETSY1_46485 [Candidatus Entotheonella factor]
MDNATHHFEQSHFGTLHEVGLYDEVSIELLEYATAGFRWEITYESPEAVEVIDSEYVPPESDAAGAAGLRRFRLRLVREGHVRLALQMICPFRKDDPPAASGTIELQVRP